MYSQEQHRQILELWEQGKTKSEIARRVGIPQPTVRDCIKRYGSVAAINSYSTRLTIKREETDSLKRILFSAPSPEHTAHYKAYAYLLSIYLGDGSIVKIRNVFRLRITLDAHYPGIVDYCIEKLGYLFSSNSIGKDPRIINAKLSCFDVSLYHKYLPDFFPQHDAKPKHKRLLKLFDWQQSIIDTYPIEFLRGLFHADGSRFINRVGRREYTRYQFTNHSPYIREMFTRTCDRLGIRYTVKKRTLPTETLITDVYISRLADVAFLDEHIGPKA